MSNGYEQQFRNQFNQLSNPNSQYFQRANKLLQGNMNSGSATVNSLLGAQLAMGGSYKGSLEAARRQRRAIETRNAEAANRGTNQLFINSQGAANQSLQGAQGAYEYEDSQPGFFDYLAGPLGHVAGALTGGLLGSNNQFNPKQQQQGFLQNQFNPNISQGGLGRSQSSNQFSNIAQGGLGRRYNDPYNISQGGLG